MLDGVIGVLVNGNFVVVVGFDFFSVIKQEYLDENLKNIIVVCSEDVDKLFVKDIVEVVKLLVYCVVIDDLKNIYSVFQKLEWMIVIF